MIPETLTELWFEFSTMLEEANPSDDPAYRKILITHARKVLNQAVGIWQEELVVLQGMLRSLSDAESANAIGGNSQA